MLASFASGMVQFNGHHTNHNASKLTYEQVEAAVPELKNHKYNVVILGYKTCPYSGKAQKALEYHISKSKRFREKSVFVGFEYGETAHLKKTANYSGTFPIVFVRDENGKMQHIGGGVDFEYWVKKDLRV